LAVGLLLGLGALLAISAAVGSPFANSTIFDDPTGDAAEGPDITRVRVTTRDDGQLILELTMPNREGLVGTEAVAVYMDTDRNGSTGYSGIDFVFVVFARSGRAYLDKWTGTSFARQRQLLDSGYSSRSVIFRASQTEIALSGYLDFYIISFARNDGTNPNVVGDRTTRWRHSLTPGGATTARAPSSPADTDGDGVGDLADRCVTRKAGFFDVNRNGCPGPYKRMSALSLTNPNKTFNNETWWTPDRPAILGSAAPRARVEIRDGNESEVGRTDAAGRFRSRKMSLKRYALGRVISFKVNKAGWIGAYLEIEILNRLPGWEVRRRLCVPATGGSPAPCSRVDRGR